jgi:hypothetical protein
MSKEELTLSDILSKIQQKFHSKKSRHNKFGNYSFRSAEDILEAIKPFEAEYGVFFIIREELIDNSEFPIIKSTASINLKGGDSIKAEAIVGVDLNQKGMQMPQKFGSASSYGKKYALGNLLLIDDTQDPDAGKAELQDMSLASFAKAKVFISKGGDISKIKMKYNLTPEQEKALIATPKS